MILQIYNNNNNNATIIITITIAVVGKGTVSWPLMEVGLFHDTASECHLPYGITQCYLLPDISEHTTAGTRFTYPGGIEG